MTNFYNEIDSYAAQWLRNLIAAGHIPPGVVDERSIVDIDPGELRRYTQCHFFAGIGVWSYALRRAGWPDDRPVWTGSCPCQPFSAAGKRKGHEDERHLWPAWARLIRECRPDSILGEQVSGPDGLAWLDVVCTDLEDSRYTVGALVATAAGVGAPHGRHRIYFMAHTRGNAPGGGFGVTGSAPRHAGQPDGADTIDSPGHMDHPAESGLALWGNHQDPGRVVGFEGSTAGGTGPVNGFWADAEWVLCRDPKGPRWRPIEPGSFPVVDGASSRVGRLRAYGNGLCAETAVNFIRAAKDVMP